MSLVRNSGALAIFLLITACTDAADDEWDVGRGVGPAIVARVERANGVSFEFDLSDVTDFDWTRVHFVPPYAGPKQIEELIGVKWPGVPPEGLLTDTMSLLVFTNASEVVAASYVEPRGGFSNAEGWVIEREGARFGWNAEHGFRRVE